MVSRRFVENCLIIWLDPDINDDRNLESIEQFRQIINEVHIFNELDLCINYISDLHDERILLIVSEEIGQQIVPLVHELSQIEAIYLFCSPKPPEWTSYIRKFRGAADDFETLCQMLKSNVRLIERENFGFDVVGSASFTPDSRNKQEAAFMYTQLMKDIFMEMKNDSLTEMITFCREQYRNNTHELRLIDEFERDYKSDRAIHWYTREGFIYKMVNKALRTQNVEVLYQLRTFIRHLHMHLVDCYEQQQNQALTHVLYRGQRMSKGEFEKIRQNKGGLLSVSNFLSTSEDRSLAQIYAGLPNDMEEAILFEIKIDHGLGAATSPFANIQALSHFGQDEKEWLFSLGSIFRISDIEKTESNVAWSVCLLLTNEYDQQLKSMTEHFQNDILIGLISPIHSLAKLTYKMGNYRSALEYYQMALHSATLWRRRSLILHEIGNSNERLAFYEDALSYYEQALEIERSHVDEKIDSHRLAEIQLSMAGIYSNMQEKDRSLTYLREALNLELSIEVPNRETLKNIYNDIGVILYAKKQYDEALWNYRKALNLCKEIYPSTHPDIGLLLMSIATVYEGQGRHEDALDAFRKSLDIQLASLPADHPDLARSYNNIAGVYCSMGRYEDGLNNCKYALTIYLKRMPENHPNLAILYNNMIRLCNNLSRLDESLNFQLKKLDIQKATLQPDDPAIGISYNTLAATLRVLHRFEEAVEFALKAVALTTKVFGADHPSTRVCLKNLQDLYNCMP